MIIRFRHKGLRQLYEIGDRRRVSARSRRQAGAHSGTARCRDGTQQHGSARFPAASPEGRPRRLPGRDGVPQLAGGFPQFATVHDWIGHLPAIRAGEVHPEVDDHRAARLSALNQERIQATPEGGGNRDWPEGLQLKCHGETSGYSDVYGRMSWDRPASAPCRHISDDARNEIARELNLKCVATGVPLARSIRASRSAST